MRSVYRDRYGGPEVLSVREVELPTPRPGEVLVRVRVATVNRTDCGGLLGKPFVYRFFAGFPGPKHKATGCDFAGEIMATGLGVERFAVGDRVWGINDNGAGSHAQYITFPAEEAIARIPEGVSYEDAVASAEGAHYALNFINKVKFAPGAKVLVNGGTGAIGSAAIQLLGHRGLHVTAVCGPEHVERVRALGPDRVIDYAAEDFTKGDVRYDFVFDAVGKSTFGQSKAVLEPKGIYISSELGPGGQNIFLALIGPLTAGQKVIFPIPVDLKGSVAHMNGLLAEGRFKPLIDRSYPMEEVREAFEYVLSGQKVGNVILRMD